MSANREWMYKRLDGGLLNQTFLEGLETFIEFALSQHNFKDGDNIKCPCTKCDNVPYRDEWTVRTHVCRYGFVKNYEDWRFHGETLASSSNSGRRPPYMSENVCGAWNAKWAAEDYRQKSTVARRNRMTEPSDPGTGIAIHRGGTRSAYEHSQLLKDGTPKNKQHFAVYNRLHKKDEFSDTPKSAHYVEEIESEVAELSQPPPGSTKPLDVDENAVVIDKLGGINSKGLIYGIGSQGRMYNAARGSSSQARVDPADLENASLKRKIRELEESVKRKITKLEESVKAQVKEMQAQFEATVDARVSTEVQAQVGAQLEDQMKILCKKFILGWKPPEPT